MGRDRNRELVAESPLARNENRELVEEYPWLDTHSERYTASEFTLLDLLPMGWRDLILDMCGKRGIISSNINRYNQVMKQLIACCGLDCENCAARIATVNNDDELREKTAKEWSVLINKPEITPSMSGTA